MKIRELLSDESKWTQGTSSKDARGRDVAVDSKNAACWCLFGAVVRCYPLDYMRVSARIAQELGVLSEIRWNDAPERTFADVRALIERLDI